MFMRRMNRSGLSIISPRLSDFTKSKTPNNGKSFKRNFLTAPRSGIDNWELALPSKA